MDIKKKIIKNNCQLSPASFMGTFFFPHLAIFAEITPSLARIILWLICLSSFNSMKLELMVTTNERKISRKHVQ